MIINHMKSDKLNKTQYTAKADKLSKTQYTTKASNA